VFIARRETETLMQRNENHPPRAVNELLAACYRERAGKPRRLSYVRVQKTDEVTKPRTVFTFLWK
jgi:hypothetical protein